jgi:hypothetical protein
MSYALLIWTYLDLHLDARAVAPGNRRKSTSGSLDIPFHGPVNFSLRANTDIEEKFAVRPDAKAFFGKTAAALRPQSA